MYMKMYKIIRSSRGCKDEGSSAGRCRVQPGGPHPTPPWEVILLESGETAQARPVTRIRLPSRRGGVELPVSGPASGAATRKLQAA